MNIIVYAVMTYGITAVIALAVMAIITGIGKIMGKSGEGEAND